MSPTLPALAVSTLPRPSRWFGILLGFCMFSTGASGLVNEYVLATITTYILGNSIEQFSLVIASMMLMMGLAGFVQQKMSDDHLFYKFLGVEVAMALLGGFAPLVIYGAYGMMQDHFQYLHYFFVLSIGFLIGLEIPIVMRLVAQNKIELKANLAIVYAMDYIGAFIGAMIWVHVLLRTFPLTEISFIVSGFNFAVALVAVLYFMWIGAVRRRWLISTMLLLTASALLWGYSQNRDLSALFEQRFYDDPIVHQETTKYQHLVITENNVSGDVRLYINGNSQFSSLDEARYHDFLVHPVMNVVERHPRVLVLGGGDGLALRELRKYPDIESITLVDLDPEMVQLATRHPSLRRLNQDAFADARLTLIDPEGVSSSAVRPVLLQSSEPLSTAADSTWVASVEVLHLDADRFVQDIDTQPYDVIIIDLPDPASVEISKLYSRQFYHSLRQLLAPGGMIAVQATSPYHAKEAFLAIGRTLQAAGLHALPYRQNIPSFGDWGFYLAWRDRPSEAAMAQRIRDISSLAVDTVFITPDLLHASLAFGKGELESQTDCVNTLMYPCLTIHYTNYGWLID